MRRSWLLLGLLVLAACTSSAPAQVTPVAPAEYDALASQADVTVIDVHTPRQEQLANTDYVIRYDELEQIQQAIPAKDARVLIYCRSGSMSEEVTQQLIQAGYSNVYELDGGRNNYVHWQTTQ